MLKAKMYFNFLVGKKILLFIRRLSYLVALNFTLKAIIDACFRN